MKLNRKNGGFTLIELVVTITIVVILLSAATIGIVQYMRYAEFKRQNEYAQTLFNAAQTQLAQDSQLGNLAELAECTDGSLVPLDSLRYEGGAGVTAEQIWGIDEATYQGEIRYIMATPEDYDSYINGTLTDRQKIQLYRMFDAFVYDKSILRAAICVEFDAGEGMVYSVLYSDRAEGFSYTGDSGTTVSISDRSVKERKERMLGYYGVDTLSKSTSPEAEKPVISNVLLNNVETLNLSFNLSKVSTATALLNYELIVYDAPTRTPLLSINFNDENNASGHKLVAQTSQNSAHNIRALVTSYLEGGPEPKEYLFPAWVTSDLTVVFVLDAVDLGATVQDYLDGDLDDTFSLHRLGVDAKKIYCTIQGSGTNYKTTARKESNDEQPYFGSYADAVGGRTYTIFNARHLNNMRYVECDEAQPQTNFTLTSDISWQGLIEANAVFLDKSKPGNQSAGSDHILMPTDSAEDRAFVSIEQLRENDVLQSTGKGFSICDISFSEDRNSSEVSLDGYESVTGLFLQNNGTVRKVSFKNAVSTGKENVGIVCGVNAGNLSDITIASGAATGRTQVGGVMGRQILSGGELTLSNLVNRASVTGVSSVGGIVGCLEAGANDKISVTDCRNYGKITGVADTDGSLDTEYLGGITGRTRTTGGGTIQLEGCTSSPQGGYADISALRNNLAGSFVGGIIGYNDGADITNCNTANENGKSGYVIGDRFVGGIVGYNKSGLLNGLTARGQYSPNQANVVGNEYVGGIAGVNANIKNSGVVDEAYDGALVLSSWTNQGVVVAIEGYAGGIVGFNAGQIIDCGSDVTYDATARNLLALGENSADYVGGIIGYNCGRLNTSSAQKTVSVVTAVRGKNYIGGVIGLNSQTAQISNYELQGSYVKGNIFVGGYIGLNMASSLIDDGQSLHSNPNSVEGAYCVAGVLGGNIIGTNGDVTASYNTYNILGSVAGKEFVGGFIGYNQLANNDQQAKKAAEFIIQTLENDGLDNLQKALELAKAPGTNTNAVLTINGSTSELLSITADIFVGGVIGYNNASSFLHIKNVTNRTPITARTAVQSHIQGIDDTAMYSYAGGVVGLVADNVVVDGCKNEGLGAVNSELSTYTGGIAEVNCGLIINCRSNSGGSNTIDYIGGIVGLNTPDTESVRFGKGGAGGYTATAFEQDKAYVDNSAGGGLLRLGIFDCSFDGTLAGRSAVGGIAAVNNGVIYNPIISGTVTGYNDKIGGVAGINEENGKITLESTLKIDISGSGARVGGVIGENSGELMTAEGSAASFVAVDTGHTVSGEQYVGGIIGAQIRKDTTLTGLVNAASVTANNGFAGGIVGGVDAEGTEAQDVYIDIVSCQNWGGVQSTLSGAAGGIIAYASEECSILECIDGASVASNNGIAGGITAINDGLVQTCGVYPHSSAEGISAILQRLLSGVTGSGSLSITGNEKIGAVTGENNGTVIACTVKETTVSNNITSGEESFIGGIAGENRGSITLGAETLESVSVKAYTNACNIGGVAGINRGSEDDSEIDGQDYTGGRIYTQSGEQAIIGINEADKYNSVSLGFGNSSVTYGDIGGVAGANGGLIANCAVFADIAGRRGDSAAPDYGYGGIAGINEGKISDCSFDGRVYTNGTVSAIAPTGGIAGKNVGGTILRSIVGTELDTEIACGNAKSAYGYVGGLVGWNDGDVLGCDNHEYSMASEVSITGYAGHIGGAIGFNDESGCVSGYEPEGGTQTDIVRISTGDNWKVNAKYYSNDCGTGGLIGYSSSGNDIRYADNYAQVLNTSSQSTNTAVGGIIGRLENKVKYNFHITNCANYGDVWSNSLNGGFIGRWKYLGGTIENSSNYGNIGFYPSGQSGNVPSSAGFVASFYQITTGCRVLIRSCSNYGDIIGSTLAAGINGRGDESAFNLTLSDCVNTGTISGYGSSTACAGISVINQNIYERLYRCRNYGNSGSKTAAGKFCGIVSGKAQLISDCFNYSNASIKRPITDSNDASSANNYYVYTGDKEILQSNTIKINASASSFDGVGGASMAQDTDKKNYFSNTYDESLSTRCSVSYKDTRIISDANTITLTYSLLMPTSLNGIGIKWCNSGTYGTGVCRQYVYKLYYVDSEGNQTEITSPDTANGGQRETYNESLGMYAEAGYSTIDDPDNTYYHAFDDAIVRQFIIEVHAVKNRTGEQTAKAVPDGEVWSGKGVDAAKYVCMFGILGTKTGETVDDMNASPNDHLLTAPANTGGTDFASTGTPLAPEADGYGTYYLRDGQNIFTNLTNLPYDPVGIGRGTTENGSARTDISFVQDFSSYEDFSESANPRMNRFKIIQELEPGINYFHKLIYSYMPEMTSLTVADIGSAYTLKWTSNIQAYDYEVSYRVRDEESGETLVRRGDVVYTTTDKEITVDSDAEFGGDDITFYVRAIYWNLDSSGNITKAYTSWVTADSVTLKKILPTPQVRLELTGTDSDSYKAVLENVDDYYDGNGELINATIEFSVDAMSASFQVREGQYENLAIAGGGNSIITYQATTQGLSDYQRSAYMDSMKRSVQTRMFSAGELKGTDYCNTGFAGFYGNSSNSMYYQLTLDKASTGVETYYYTELAAYSEELDTDVVMSYGESHVTGYGMMMTATLSELDSELLSRDGDIIVRSYPWRTQAYQAYFGHVVAESVTLEELLSLEDDGNIVYTPEGGFENGYVAQLNGDGTYRIIYSTILANPEVYAKQIDSIVYNVNAGDRVITSKKGSNNIQPQPVIESGLTYDPGRDTYTFIWDRGLGFTSAKYQITLIGISEDGTKAEISSLTTDESFYDAGNDCWQASFGESELNFPNVIFEAERLGTLAEDGATLVFPSKASNIFNLKVQLPQIARPTVSFYAGDEGIIEKNDLIYTVSWAGIRNASQLSELAEYEISVSYTMDGVPMTLRLLTSQSEEDVSTVLSGTAPMLYAESPTASSAVMNLNSLAAIGGSKVTVSIRAIAKDGSAVYRNGPDGVGLTLTLASRMETPDLSLMQYQAESVMSVASFTDDGVILSMSQGYTVKGTYEMTAEIVEPAGAGEYAHVADITNDRGVISSENPISMDGGLEDSYCNISGISAEYAGKYLKIALRAVGDSSISSVWTFDDPNAIPYVYFRLPTVKVDTPDAIADTTTVTYTHGSTAWVDWDVIDQHSLSFSKVQYANEYLIDIVMSPRDVDINDDQDHTVTDAAHIRVADLLDGSYEVYYSQTGLDGYETEQYMGTIGEEELELPYAYLAGTELVSLNVTARISASDDTITLILPDCDEEYAYPTSNVTIQAIAEDAENYVDSGLFSWYRSRSGMTEIIETDTFDEPFPAPECDIEVQASIRPGIAFELSMTDGYCAVMRVEGGGITRLYGVPALTSGSTVSSILLLDSDTWGGLSGEEIQVSVRYVVDMLGMSKWSEPLTVTLP